jgi:hypothetical protein
MKINLEILDAIHLTANKEVENLNTKTLVPKMVFRRRLTRASKLIIEAVSHIGFEQGRIFYSSAFGELPATANILNAIDSKQMISPTDFQNSVYNTPVSYLSILHQNTHEIMTISSGDNSAKKLLKMAAVKALDEDEILLLATETLNIENIEQVNTCIDSLETVVALKVRITKVNANTFVSAENKENYPLSIAPLIDLTQKYQCNKQPTVIGVEF